MTLTKSNYIILAISIAVIVLGFILMSGTGSSEESFTPDIFSSTRIKVAPLVCFIGFVGIIAGIMYKGKETK